MCELLNRELMANLNEKREERDFNGLGEKRGKKDLKMY